MSDSSGISCDSDADPDYEEESSSISEYEDPQDSPQEDLRKSSSVAVVPSSSKVTTRPTSPSKISAINLSDTESSSDEEVDKSINKECNNIEPINEPQQLEEVTHTVEQPTNYDFSHIINSQNQLSKAREEHDLYNEKENIDISSSQYMPVCLDEPSISELLAIGEKQTVSQDQSELESESDVEVPQKSIQITLERPANNRVLSKKNKRDALIEKQLQLIRKENQLLLHKVHLLCLVGHGLHVNSKIINNQNLYGHLLSLLPEGYTPPVIVSPSYIKKVLLWFGKLFTIKRQSKPKNISTDDLIDVIGKKKPFSVKESVVLFVSLLRGLGLTVRFVMSLQPVPLQPPKIKIQSNKNNGRKKDVKVKETINTPSTSKSSPKLKASTTMKSKTETHKKKEPIIKTKSKSTNKKSTAVRVLSSDSEDEEESKLGIDFWAEVFLEKDNKWIAVDVFNQKVDCENEIYGRCSLPVVYIVGFKNNNSIKEVTRRYVPSWMLKSKKSRVEPEWWKPILFAFREKEAILEQTEDEMLDHNEVQMNTPIPSKISALKNHPMYALKRHLLKYEGIYPPDAAPLGFLRGEAVYSRFCVHELFSREKWIRQGKCVRVNEKPYKIVKSRSKADKFPGVEKPLELFGHWQVEDYIAPPAIDGKVPRNEYGNVEVYKASMLPAGTVHMQVPGILKLARKMDIDCAPAVIGWEHHGGRSHPVIEGVVVCKEYQDVLLDAWNAEMDASAQRSDHKRKQRIFQNWMKFVKSVIIKSNLKKKYNFGDFNVPDKDNEPPKKLPKI